MIVSKLVRRVAFPAVVAAALVAVPARGQSQVNPQANTAAAPAQNGTPQSPQAGQPVHQEIYGNNGPATPVRHYQSSVLPSEARYVIERSGVTPSELRTQADRVGPLSPEGPLSYIPIQSSLQRAMGVPQLQLVNPAYGNEVLPRTPQPLPAPTAPALVQPELVRPTEPPPTGSYVPPARLDAGRMLTAPSAIGSSGLTEGTVVYTRPVRPPTTAPTTQPSSPGDR